MFFGVLACGQTTPWSATGNAGTNPATNFLGTTDKKPLIIQPDGSFVGVGTTNPTSNLDVQSATGNAWRGTTSAASNASTGVVGTSLHGYGVSGIGANIGVYAHNSGVGHDAYLASPCCAGDFYGDVHVQGKTITQALAVTGSSAGGISLDVQSSTGAAIAGTNTAGNSSATGVVGTSTSGYGVSGIGANIGVFAHNSAVGHDVYLAAPCCAGDFYGDVLVHGKTTTKVLEITGGGDLAEPFQIVASIPVEPGLVVAIHPSRPGQLRIADQPYDRTVAGIVSGANGLATGLALRDATTMNENSPLVAMSGRVYCWADAINGPIQPGDLLTSSATPGHAMKVTDHARAQGAVIGKAMSVLEHGTGLVLVLISLQ